MAAGRWPRCAQWQIIAQEIAIEFCILSFVLVIAEHTLGVANKLADMLSRRRQPGAVTEEPTFLAAANEVLVPRRGKEYYST